jgi:CRP-like cAMP-binding protein
MDDASALLEKARDALDSGDLRLALACFLRLEELENDPAWARRAAQIYHELHDHVAEVEALNRAARELAKRGDILKSAVLSKQILALNPHHIETLRRIPELHAARQEELKHRPPAAKQPAAGAAQNQALAALELSKLMPNVSTRAGVKGVYAVALEDEVAADFAPEPVVRAAVEAEVEQAEKTSDALRSTLFAQLSPKSFESLLMKARIVELEDGEEVFHQGDPGDALYVIAHGTVGVIDEGPPRRGVAKLGEGQFFGEIALFANTPRTATIAALTGVQLIAINREVVHKLIAEDAQFLSILLRFFRDRLVDRLLATNALFTVLSPHDREVLKKRFRFLEVEPGAALIEEGKIAEGLIILLSGRAEVLRNDPPSVMKLGELSPGDIAGEISLLTNLPAIGTVRALEKCWAIELPAAAFQKIIHARPDAMTFIRGVIDQRVAQAHEILAGRAEHAEGNVGRL